MMIVSILTANVILLIVVMQAVGEFVTEEEALKKLCDGPLFSVDTTVVRGKQAKEPPIWLTCDGDERRTYNCKVNKTAIGPCAPEPWVGPAAQVMSPGTCPYSLYITTHVALDAVDASRPLLVTLQSIASRTKYATYYNATNTTKVLKAMEWASSSTGSESHATPTAYFGPIAVVGYRGEDRLHSAIVNGSEDVSVTYDVGAALLHTGVDVGGDGDLRVAAQTVLAHPTSTQAYNYGISAAIVELAEGTDYHIAIGTAVAVVHMYRVVAGSGGGGWGSPAVTLLSTLAAPWGWGTHISSLAARGATAGGRPAALVVGTYFDSRCGVTATWAGTCTSSGSAHVYTLNSSSGAWQWNGTLKARVVKNDAQCGVSVAVAGDVVAVGCSGDPSPSTAVDVGEARTDASNVGAAHTWRLNAANASASVREGYLKAFTAAVGQQFGWSVAVVVNATHEVVAVGAPFASTGAPYGNMSASLAMPYDVSVDGSGKQPTEGDVWTFVHAVNSGAGTWRVAHRVKPPVGGQNEQFGRTLTASATPAGQVVLGVGTYNGCKGYVVVLA